MSRKIIIEIISALFILLFFYAAVSKLVSYEKFVGQIGKSPLLTDYAVLVALFIPSIELLICLGLVFHKTRTLGMYSAFGLMVLFSIYIVAIISFSTELPCSCGGVLNSLSWKQHLVFNLVFVCLGLTGIFLLYHDKSSTITKELL